jgi:DNA-binding NarL/FixJ family response regulator
MVSSKPRLILADDHQMIREALRNTLKASRDIVATASDGEELLRVLESVRADCLLLDLDMPGRHGLALVPVIRRRHPNLRVLVVTMHNNPLLAASVAREGADGFVPKDAGVEELSRAIAEVCAGRTYVSPKLSKVRRQVELEAAHPSLSKLTPRQQQILLLMGEGKSATAIAAALDVGASTVTFHKQNIMRVLGLPSQDGLLQYAFLVRSATTTSTTPIS